MKRPGFAFCTFLLLCAGVLAIFRAGPDDSVSKIGEKIGEKLAADQMRERDEREAKLKLEMQRMADDGVEQTPEQQGQK